MRSPERFLYKTAGNRRNTSQTPDSAGEYDLANLGYDSSTALVHEQWLKSLDAFGQAAFMHDRNYKVLCANRAYAACAGLPIEKILGRPYYDVFPKIGSPRPCCVPDLESAATEECKTYEFTLPNGDAISSYAHVVHDAQGQYCYSVHILDDVTQSRATSDALELRSKRLAVLNSLLRRALEDRSLQEQLEGVLDDLLSLPWLPLTPKGGIFLVDENDPQQLILKAERNLPSSLMAICAKVPFGHCLCGRAALSARLVHASCVDDRHENQYDGMLPHGHYAVPLVSSNTMLGVIILYVAHAHQRCNEEEEFLQSVANTLAGVIVRYQSDMALRASEQRLTTIAAHMARLRTAGEMAAELAHELKQPLTAIKTNAQVGLRALTTGRIKTDLVSEVLVDVKESSQRAATIIDQLRSFVKKTEPQRQPVDINQLVRDISRLIDIESRPKGIELSLKLTDSLPAVLADTVQVGQVILNLARNGIEAMNDVKLPSRRLSIETKLADPGTVSVRVLDTGHGIPHDKQALIFEPFYSSRDEGLGMGLCITRSIVEAHGGSIELQSEPERGSTFSFTLPTVA